MMEPNGNEFTIDKLEYQSVFKVFDKENTGKIDIKQVNQCIRKFEQIQLVNNEELKGNNSSEPHSASDKPTTNSGSPSKSSRVLPNKSKRGGQHEMRTQGGLTSNLQSNIQHYAGNNNSSSNQAAVGGVSRSAANHQQATHHNRQLQQPNNVNATNHKAGLGSLSGSNHVQNNNTVNGQQQQHSTTLASTSGSSPTKRQTQQLNGGHQQPHPSHFSSTDHNQSTAMATNTTTNYGGVGSHGHFGGAGAGAGGPNNSSNVTANQINSNHNLGGGNVVGNKNTILQLKPTQISSGSANANGPATQHHLNSLNNSEVEPNGSNIQNNGIGGSGGGGLPSNNHQQHPQQRQQFSGGDHHTNQGGSDEMHTRTQGGGIEQGAVSCINPGEVPHFPNGKQHLEFEEFIDIIKQSCADADTAENYLVFAFSMFDREKKGYIVASDLKCVFELLGETVSDDEINNLFDGELEEFQKKAKSEEEIAKMCTKEDLTELQRGIVLLRKGYEVQKLSIINHLDRYMKEPDANEELLSLIIGSLEDWDENMQIECANAFIKPLQQNEVTHINVQRILRLAVDITTNEHCENQKLQESWIIVFANCVSRVDAFYLKSVAIKAIQEMCSPKNPLVKRQRGNTLAVELAKNVGEEALDEEPIPFRLISGMCLDTNFLIRLHAAHFFKDYLQANREELIKGERLQEVYLPEIYELVNDEDPQVRIEAIEALLEVLESLDIKSVEEEFTPNLLKALENIDRNSEIIERMSKQIGRIAFKLSHFDLHLKYKEPLLGFYKETLAHPTESIVKNALYNLPCFHQLYKDIVTVPPQPAITSQSGTSAAKSPSKKDSQKMGTASTTATTMKLEDANDLVDDPPEEESGNTPSDSSKAQGSPIELDFKGLYLRFANEQSIEIRELVAACLHEAFKISTDTEDLRQLHSAFSELLEEENKEVLAALVSTIGQILKKYANKHTLSLHGDGQTMSEGERTPNAKNEPFQAAQGSGGGAGSGLIKHSNTLGGGRISDFTSASLKESRANRGGTLKKQSTLGINEVRNYLNFGKDDQTKEDGDSAQEGSAAQNYIILPVYRHEMALQELLPKLITFDGTIAGMIGMWREHCSFLEQLADCVDQFHAPELQDQLVSQIFVYIQNGNNHLRQATIKLLVALIAHQHDPGRREKICRQINETLGESKAFQLRRTFGFFCRKCAGVLTRKQFLDTFYPSFYAQRNDKVPQVRMEFAKALVDIKPFVEEDQDRNFELMECIDKLREDSDYDVADAIENTDMQLMKERKLLSSKFMAAEETNLERDAQLRARWDKEEEERKRRQEEEEEQKFDINTLLLDTKKTVGTKKRTTMASKRNANQKDTNSKTFGTGGRQIVTNSSLASDSGIGGSSASRTTTGKRKALVKRNSSALPSVNEMYSESGGAGGSGVSSSGNNSVGIGGGASGIASSSNHVNSGGTGHNSTKQVHRQKSVLIPQKQQVYYGMVGGGGGNETNLIENNKQSSSLQAAGSTMLSQADERQLSRLAKDLGARTAKEQREISDGYKRYQMMVGQSGSGGGGAGGSLGTSTNKASSYHQPVTTQMHAQDSSAIYKRSSSLLANDHHNKKAPPRRLNTMVQQDTKSRLGQKSKYESATLATTHQHQATTNHNHNLNNNYSSSSSDGGADTYANSGASPYNKQNGAQQKQKQQQQLGRSGIRGAGGGGDFSSYANK